ncbi:MAG: cytochrome c biogenesis protein CcdA [Coriobacteriia bacterium]|nr:cytochrome c biogenesis protein CcdA [Coriobacteriia bacterium]
MISSLISSNISLLLVFLSGTLSFFSPCILPVIPLYLGYLAGGSKKVGDDGEVSYTKSRVALHTIFFVIGISAAFFLLGLTFSALGQALISHRTILSRISAVIIILFGVFMLWPDKPVEAQQERRIKMPQFKSVNPLVALVMGFLFSFAWTPCVGPALSTILLMSANAATSAGAFTLIGIYTLGFIIPFILLGLFSTRALNWLKNHANLLQISTKILAGILIILGISMLTGWFNNITSPISKFNGADSLLSSEFQEQQNELAQSKNPNKEAPASSNETTPDKSATSSDSAANSTEAETETQTTNPRAPQLMYPDQTGKLHSLANYKGKVVFLNFWATWCPPCRKEMPDIQKLYENYNENQDEVVILGVANPKSAKNPNNIDESKEEVIAFLNENNLSFPVMMDEEGASAFQYQVQAFPTTYIINKDGTIAGYIPGALTYELMDSVIQEVLAKPENQNYQEQN